MQKTITILGLASLLAISIAKPSLYAQCVSEEECGKQWTDPLNQFYCHGENPQQAYGSEQAYWLAGGDACGIVYVIATGQPTNTVCGMLEIVTECA